MGVPDLDSRMEERFGEREGSAEDWRQVKRVVDMDGIGRTDLGKHNGRWKEVEVVGYSK